MNKVTIGFSKPKNKFFPIVSWLIRWFEKTPYSHTFLEFYIPSINREVIFEAVGSGVRLIRKDKWEKHAETVKSFTIDIKQCNYNSLLQYCIDNQDDSYGFMQNVGIVVANLFNLKHNPFPNHKNCSELVYAILEKEGYKINKNKNLITPKDVFEVLSSK